MQVEVGQVMYYYAHIKMAVLLLKSTLLSGDQIHIQGAASNFDQSVEFMEIDHSQVLWAHPGDNVALKVNQRVRKGDIVYRIIEEVKVKATTAAFESMPAIFDT